VKYVPNNIEEQTFVLKKKLLIKKKLN
jgi:hypothetical protein